MAYQSDAADELNRKVFELPDFGRVLFYVEADVREWCTLMRADFEDGCRSPIISFRDEILFLNRPAREMLHKLARDVLLWHERVAHPEVHPESEC